MVTRRKKRERGHEEMRRDEGERDEEAEAGVKKETVQEGARGGTATRPKISERKNVGGSDRDPDYRQGL